MLLLAYRHSSLLSSKHMKRSLQTNDLCLYYPLTIPSLRHSPLHNIRYGIFNVHCVLYGYDNAYRNQFISWNNGPIGPGKDETIRSRHPDQGELWLDRNDSVDGEHTLHYPPAGPNPNQAQACLTISYQDLFGNKLVSIFDYTSYHEWVRVFVSVPSSPKITLDLKELNDRKKQKVP